MHLPEWQSHRAPRPLDCADTITRLKQAATIVVVEPGRRPSASAAQIAGVRWGVGLVQAVALTPFRRIMRFSPRLFADLRVSR
jgi:hypothetical protein